jgi:hypothetical protein
MHIFSLEPKLSCYTECRIVDAGVFTLNHRSCKLTFNDKVVS